MNHSDPYELLKNELSDLFCKRYGMMIYLQKKYST
jgi:uncharacterized protein YqgQ